MNRDTIQKLLGGYATGTLTPDEQQALFAAALEDQELFDALAREQSLRDLLRDPAARAQVLTALDDAPRAPWYRTWYQRRWFVQRPWLPVLAAAALVEIGLLAVVAVRRQTHAPAPAIVAELKSPERQMQEEARAPAASLPDGREVLKKQPVAPEALMRPRRKPAGIAGGVVGGVPDVKLSQPGVNTSPVEVQADRPAAIPVRKDETAATGPAPQQQAQSQPAPYVQNQQPLGMTTGAVSRDSKTPDARFGTMNARVLFYDNRPGTSAGSGGRAETSEKASAKKAVPMPMRATGSLAATNAVASAVAHLGVRCSILRKQPTGEFNEVGLDAVLDIGEVVRLKLLPNDYGYLVVWDVGPNGAWRQVAGGPAEPLKPFETPLAGDSGAGPRQLYVQFTRNGLAGLAGAMPESLPAQARNNLIQTETDASEKATYVVNRVRDPAALQLIVPITLNYK